MKALAERLGQDFASRLAVPVIAAPMFQVSNPDLVIAACRAGVIGAFPTSNCRTIEQLDDWLTRIGAATAGEVDGRRPAPACANLIIRQARLEGDLACLIRHGIEMVITSVGSPAAVLGPLHDIGCKVFADVISLAHARKAIDAGVDGLVLLTAGAGGQTGWANPLSFIDAVRPIFDGPIVLAGGVGSGQAVWGARVLGYDLAYMGTRFIASDESAAKPAYKQMLVDSTLDDIMTTRAFTGLDSNMLRPSLVAAGFDPELLSESVTPQQTSALFGAAADGPKRWTDIWSAGHSTSSVHAVLPAADIVERTISEYAAARAASALID